MGVSAAIALGAAVVGPPILQGLGILPKPPEAGPLLIEQAPKPASATPTQDTKQAGEQQRKRAAAASGRSDTIKTGSQGLGATPAANLQQKTLLGY